MSGMKKQNCVLNQNMKLCFLSLSAELMAAKITKFEQQINLKITRHVIITDEHQNFFRNVAIFYNLNKAS